MRHEIWLTLPDGTEHELQDRMTIGRGLENDLTFTSKKVSREFGVKPDPVMVIVCVPGSGFPVKTSGVTPVTKGAPADGWAVTESVPRA